MLLIDFSFSLHSSTLILTISSQIPNFMFFLSVTLLVEQINLFFCLGCPDLRRHPISPQLPKSWLSSLHGFSPRIFLNIPGLSILRLLQSSYCFVFHAVSLFQCFFNFSWIQHLPNIIFTLCLFCFLSFAPVALELLQLVFKPDLHIWFF